MRVITSGRAGLIAIERANGFDLENVDTGETRSVSARDLPYIFSGCDDLVVQQQTSLDEVRRKAKEARRGDQALLLLLIMLDPKESADGITELAAILNEEFESRAVVDYVEARLYSHELPTPIAFSRLSEALTQFPRVLGLIERFLAHQSNIAHVRSSFLAIPDEVLPQNERPIFWRAGIDRALVRSLVLAAASSKGIDAALLGLHLGLKDLPNYRAVISAWTEGFKRTPKIARDWSALKEPPSPAPLAHAPPSGWRESLEQSLRQQRSIVDQIKAGDVETARRFAADLVRNQQRVSEPEHIAKALTSLSQAARKLQAWELNLEWAREAVSLKGDDPRTHTQVAEALVHFGRFNEALESLRLAAAFGAEEFAATLAAKILRLQNKLPEALEAYREGLKRYRTSEAAHYFASGVAEVLKDMDRLDEALEIYEETSKLYPDEIAIQNGLAATLAELGRLDDAAGVYQRVIQRNYDPVARNGLAMLYREVGDLDAARRILSELVVENPFDIISRCALSDVFRQMRDFDSALKLAQETADRFPESATAYKSLGDVFLYSGNTVEAARHFKIGAERFPYDHEFLIALARIEKWNGRYDAALAAYEMALRVFPNDSLESQRATMLKRLGRVDEAMLVYDRVLQRNKNLRFALNAKASIYLYLGRVAEATKLVYVENPKTRDEWRSFFLLGIADLKRGRFDDVLLRFERAVSSVPFEREKRIFSAMIASLEARRGHFPKARSLADECKGDVTALVRFHVLAAANDQGAAAEAYRELAAIDLPERYSELRDEIAKAYGLISGHSARGKAWIFETEQGSLILEVA